MINNQQQNAKSKIKKKVFYSGGPKQITLTTKDNKIVDVDIVRKESDKNNKVEVPSSTPQVEEARSEFDLLMASMPQLWEISKDPKYPPPPKSYYRNQAKPIRPKDAGIFQTESAISEKIIAKSRHTPSKNKIGGKYRGETIPVAWQDPSSSTYSNSHSEYQDTFKPFQKSVDSVHQLPTSNTESANSMWKFPVCDPHSVPLSEYDEKFRAFSQHEVDDEEVIPSAPPSPERQPRKYTEFEVEELRQHFVEQMGKFHTTNAGADYNTEYRKAYDHFEGNDEKTFDQEKRNFHPSSMDYPQSEYDAKYRVRPEDIRPPRVYPAAGKHTPKKENMQQLLSMAGVAMEKPKIGSVTPTKSRRTSDPLKDRSQMQATTPNSEYQERYCHMSPSKIPDEEKPKRDSKPVSPLKLTEELEDPSRHRSPKPRTHLSPPFVSEYNYSYDHVSRPESLEPHHVEYVEPSENPGVSEYEGKYCGFDRQYEAEHPSTEREDLEGSVLKPAYALTPSKHNKHKHRLFRSEISRGQVIRTEYMDKFLHKPKRNERQKSDISTRKKNQSKQRTTSEQGPKLTLPHEELLKKYNKESLNWWNKSGKRLAQTYNPILMNPRYAGAPNPRRAPRSEYGAQYGKAL